MSLRVYLVLFVVKEIFCLTTKGTKVPIAIGNTKDTKGKALVIDETDPLNYQL